MNWLDPFAYQPGNAAYDESRGHRIYHAVSCPRCSRRVENICGNCGRRSLEFFKDVERYDAAVGFYKSWRYRCRECTYEHLLFRRCEICGGQVEFTLFIVEPPFPWLLVLGVIAAIVIGLMLK